MHPSSDDAEAAWDQLSPQLRQKVDLEGFQAAWETRRAGLLPLAEDLKQAPQRQARVWSSLAYSDYDTLTLKLTDEGWRITGGVLDVYSQDSPRKALITFVRAAERQRFDVLLAQSAVDAESFGAQVRTSREKPFELRVLCVVLVVVYGAQRTSARVEHELARQ